MKEFTNKLLLGLMLITVGLRLAGQTRSIVPINDDWVFKGSSIHGDSIRENVNLPHTWNAKDAQAGIEYYRGTGVYSKNLLIDGKYAGKRLFLKFEGVHTVADVYLNGIHLGQHRGGYSAFVYEITGQARVGGNNFLVVRVDNLKHEDILPLGGDFNQYGGIYRPVSLLITDHVCVSPLDYSSPGVYIKQKKVTEKEAEIEVLSILSNGAGTEKTITIQTSVFDGNGLPVVSQSSNVMIASGKASEARQSMNISNPKLWNGRKSPNLYSVKVQLLSGSSLLDEVVQPLGLRSFYVDPEKGFFLNNNHLKLQGVSRHQDKKDKGSALTEEDHRTDMQLIREMGVNSLRLAHYQQSGYFYSLCDTAGMVVWAEIPFVGSMLGGYTNSQEFRENGKQQLRELIRQNYNHPSICFWGVFNELSNPKKDSPASFVKELAALAKSEDPGRLITSASLLPDGDELNFITEVVAWNKYFGWYYGAPDKLGTWADQLHKKYPQLRFAISEYGAGAGITQHEEKMRRPFPMNHPWHPEEYQAYYHERSWKAISERPYIWGCYVWNMFDFSVDFRIEGDTPGMNDKGLVTYDRKTKKDAFYLYKANWNEEPMVHINDQRFIHREAEKVGVKVYSNLDAVELFVNDHSLGILKSPDKIFIWKEVKLASGNNRIRAVGKTGDKTIQDQCVWVYKSYGWINLLIWFLRYGILPFCLIMVVTIPVLFRGAFGKRKKDRLKILYRILFFILTIVFILLLAVFLFGLKYDLNLFDYSLL